MQLLTSSPLNKPTSCGKKCKDNCIVVLSLFVLVWRANCVSDENSLNCVIKSKLNVAFKVISPLGMVGM